MRVRFLAATLFIYFCNLHAKDIYFDIEVDLPNKSSISIRYNDQINHFAPKDLVEGVVRKNVFDIVFFSNVKDSLEVLLSSKNGKGNHFSFTEETGNYNLPFLLFAMDTKKQIQNGGVIFSVDNIKEPISKVISVGMKVPKIAKNSSVSGELSTHFTVTLQHTG